MEIWPDRIFLASYSPAQQVATEERTQLLVKLPTIAPVFEKTPSFTNQMTGTISSEHPAAGGYNLGDGFFNSV